MNPRLPHPVMSRPYQTTDDDSPPSLIHHPNKDATPTRAQRQGQRCVVMGSSGSVKMLQLGPTRSIFQFFGQGARAAGGRRRRLPPPPLLLLVTVGMGCDAGGAGNRESARDRRYVSILKEIPRPQRIAQELQPLPPHAHKRKASRHVDASGDSRACTRRQMLSHALYRRSVC
jgi:hypothetical protein